ncbi:MAG: VWA domain-containing protein, partial [Polyangiaceae bacterium]|nr:VWA domain-containing protein [Polyangiaceae bacterium]
MKRFLLTTLVSTVALAAWGCAEGGGDSNDGGAGGTTTGSGPNTVGTGFNNTTASDTVGTGTCAATNAKATPTPLDIVFVLDWSGSMQGDSWEGSTTALKNFMQAPESAGISAGMVYFPTIKPDFDDTCNHQLYAVLDVPIAELPGNSFALTNSMPADAIGSPSPLYAGLKGALQAAVARQDLLPKHKVVVVMASDGGYNTCGQGITAISALATSARQYNGVQTYVIAVQSSANINFDALQTIAISGGTNGLYDASDIDVFGEKMAEIRDA